MARTIEQADILAVYDCGISECEDIHIALHDRAGEPFCAVTLSEDQAQALILFLQNALYMRTFRRTPCKKPN